MREAIDFVEITIRHVLALCIELVLIKTLVVERRRGRYRIFSTGESHPRLRRVCS